MRLALRKAVLKDAAFTYLVDQAKSLHVRGQHSCSWTTWVKIPASLRLKRTPAGSVVRVYVWGYKRTAVS